MLLLLECALLIKTLLTFQIERQWGLDQQVIWLVALMTSALLQSSSQLPISQHYNKLEFPSCKMVSIRAPDKS